MDYYRSSIKTISNSLKSDIKKGLHQSEAKERLDNFGLNKLKDKNKVNPIILFLKQFNSIIVYILLFAIFISFILGEITDAIVILVILFLNAILGFVQEYRAEKAIDELKKLSSFKVLVLRNNKKKQIDVESLVPGDIVYLNQGDRVSADCRIIDCQDLIVDESSLTGESGSVSKKSKTFRKKKSLAERQNMLYSSTLINKGKAKAIVVNTGMQTEIGKIAKMVSIKKRRTPLQKKLDKLGKLLAYSVIFICIIIFLVGIIKTGSIQFLFSGQIINFIRSSEIWLLTAVSLAVAAIPEGLPAVVTTSLSIGVKKLLKKKSLVRNLPSVETLGETTIICSDKTGTLTKDKMTVRKIFFNNKIYEIKGIGYSKKGYIYNKEKDQKEIINSLLFKIGVLCNDSNIDLGKKKKNIRGDPTEISLLISSLKNNLDFNNLRKDNPRLDEIPFNSERKLMSTVNKDSSLNKKFVYTKGAPEKILDLCNKILINGKIKKLSKKQKKKILNQNQKFASNALRVLGFSYKPYKKDLKRKDYEKDQIFVGLQAMIDPPRLEVKDAINKCKSAGVKVIMITGDNAYTAKAIAKEVGIEGIAIDGSKFFEYSKSKQKKLIKNIGILSRVEPEHKQKIVSLLQDQGEVVCMSGDGVNDAPAVKAADLGVSMGITGTDVTKSASDMVLLDDSFTTIVNAVKEGRGIYENIKKFVNYLLSSNIAEIFIIFFAILFGWSLPMTAIMLLWLNLVTDGFPALALSFDKNPKYLMKLKPKSKKENIITKDLWFKIFLISIIITAGVLYLFKINLGIGIDYARTIAFTSLVVMELVRPFDIRKDFGLKIFSNKYLIGAIIISFILQLLVIYSPLNSIFGFVPIGITSWIYILLITAFVYIIYSYLKKLLFLLSSSKLIN